MELPIKTETIGLNNFDIAKIISLYSSALAYHNFNHIVEVLLSAKKIMEDCVSEHIIVDEKIVNIAILFHDAGYHDDHTSLGFSTKESYSAFLAREFLKEKNFETNIIDQIQSAILATEKNGSFEKTESKVVRAADLYGLSSQYDIFLENAHKIKAEYELLVGRTADWEDWKLATIKLLNEFLSREIELTAFFSSKGGCSQFHKLANINLKKFSVQSNI
tara:strand:- start:323 stop:979 length:657 start_codon:yes stop_codon:yes gene_type:complete